MKPRLKEATRRFRSLGLLLALGLQSLPAAEEIIVRASLDQQSVWVGQRVQLQVDVLGRNGWAQAKPAKEITLPGSYVLPAGNTRIRLQETINGEDYSGQRYKWDFHPQRHGSTTIPELELQVSLQTWGANGGTAMHSAKTPALELSVKLPPGVDPNLPLIVSPAFRARQSWEPDASELRVGDALERTITLEATDTPAMVLPPLQQTEAAGMSLYPKDPEVEDLSTGTGRRRESITYLCQSATQTKLPAYAFQWWNPETGKLQSVKLPGKTVRIAGTPATQKKPANGVLVYRPLLYLLIPSAAALLFFSIRYSRRTIPEESLHFQTLLSSAKNADPPATCHALLLWIESLSPDSRSVLTFLKNNGSASAVQLTARLLQDPTQNFSPAELRHFATDLRRARSTYRKAERQKQQINRQLPPLNGPLR